MENQKEIWKQVIGYEASYAVSSLVNVKSIDREVKHNYGGVAVKKGKDLKKISDKDGYLFVNLKKEQKGSSQRVHRLVAIAFIPNPESKPHVNHKNGIKFDNHLENLEWNTLSENRTHAYCTGLQNGLNRRGIKSNFNKLSESQVLEIRSIYVSKKITQKELAKIFNVTQSCINSIITKKNWAYL